MDPVTTAIIAAVSAGASSEVTKKTISDGYESLKGLLKKKFGVESKVAVAVDELEGQPDAKGRRLTVEEEMTAAKVGDDAELLAAAQALLDQIKAAPRVKHNIQIAQGAGIAQASDASSASVVFHGSPPPVKND